VNDQEYCHLKQRVLALTGIDLDCYKSQQMRRRLDGFLSGLSVNAYTYCDTLRQDPRALKDLRDFLTINVSEFFRDKDQFQMLAATILPDLLRLTPRLNIWSAGCSHGAEPYSVSMILDDISPLIRHRILATDIDESILQRARSGGPYPVTDVRNVGASQLRNITRVGDSYWVTPKFRAKVEFKQLNLLRDTFESGFDLIICRNVVIYFNNEAKANLMGKFYRSLKDGGMLFMGASETMAVSPDTGFERISNCFYRKPARARELAGAGVGEGSRGGRPSVYA